MTDPRWRHRSRRTSPWCIDVGLARALGDGFGWSPEQGVEALVAAQAATLAAGTTAKRDAVARGEVPPGADVDRLARWVVDGLEADDALPSWSCWVLTALVAGVLEALDVARTSVVAVRRLDPRAPIVDVHSLVVSDDGQRSLISDPYFALVLPGAGAEEVEVATDGIWAVRTDRADGRWDYRLRCGWWSSALHYRLLAADLDRGDVGAFCAISATHSGAPDQRIGRVTASSIVEVRERVDGRGVVREWRGARGGAVFDGEVRSRETSGWAAACEALAERTGVRLR